MHASHPRYFSWVVIAAIVIVVASSAGSVGRAVGSTNPRVGSRASGASDPASAAPVVDLIGETQVSPLLTYNGFENGGTNAFPTLLTGTAASAFDSPSYGVMELAPPPPTSAHSAGLLMFPAPASTTDTIHLVGLASGTYTSGDGLEAYLFLTPTHVANWSTPYYATDPEGSNGTFAAPQGAVIFPYSTTPYIAVQWDPGSGALHSVNLYLVTPGAGGVVSPNTITFMSAGAGLAPTPPSQDWMQFNVTYNSADDSLSGVVSYDSNSTEILTFDESLSSTGFTPAVTVGSDYYFGAGGSGNGENGWGLLYLSFTNPTPFRCPAASETSGPVTSEPVVNLLGRQLVSGALVYDGFANGGTCAFPTLLAGGNATGFWPSRQSILELAPTLPTTHAAGMLMFSSDTFSNQTLSIVGAASSTYTSGDGLEAYLFMSPEHATSWSTPYYATDPDGANGTFWSPQGAVLFPYSATPYVVVQWDPAYGSVNSVTLYVVTPGVDGVVTRGSIDATAIGSGLVESPVATSFIALNVTYDVTHNYLQGTVVEESTGLVVVSFNASLQKSGFQPTYSVGSAYYFGAGGSGNGLNGWGLLYLSLSQVGGPSSGGLDLVLVFLTVGIVGFAIAAAVIIVLLRKKH